MSSNAINQEVTKIVILVKHGEKFYKVYSVHLKHIYVYRYLCTGVGYRYFKLRKSFSKFYRRHSALVEKYIISLKTLLQ